jgi:hypothetical protein
MSPPVQKRSDVNLTVIRRNLKHRKPRPASRVPFTDGDGESGQHTRSARAPSSRPRSRRTAPYTGSCPPSRATIIANCLRAASLGALACNETAKDASGAPAFCQVHGRRYTVTRDDDYDCATPVCTYVHLYLPSAPHTRLSPTPSTTTTTTTTTIATLRLLIFLSPNREMRQKHVRQRGPHAARLDLGVLGATQKTEKRVVRTIPSPGWPLDQASRTPWRREV